GAIPHAVVRGAQERSALQHLARDRDGPAVIEAVVARGAARVARHAAGRRRRRTSWMSRDEPVAGPFPDVPGHVVDAVAVRWERAHRRGPLEAVRGQVLPRKGPLPDVRHLAPARRDLVAPAELGPLEPPARGPFPLGLAGDLLAGPERV